MRYLDAVATRAALSMSAAIAAMESAFDDDREVPVRSLLGPSLFMPGRVGATTGLKAVSTVPGKPYGIVAVFGSDGACRGIVDGPTLTMIRTAAAAGLATRLLARPDARTLTILGAGAIAEDQALAVSEVRPIDDIVVWSRTPDRAEALAERVGGHTADDPDEAVHAADVVTTATPSTEPLFAPHAVRPGTHINALGAFTPAMAEIPPLTLERALVFVEDIEAAAVEAGDLLQANRTPDGTLADLLAGRMRGRTGHDDVTVFKSVGIASQDVAAGAAALDAAERLDLGVVL
jgi:alanine dehydrogenase